MPDPTARLNAALEGRYRVEREIGEGGMATVYLADDVKHERRVALKVLKPELAAVVGADRFLAEIKTTANLQHPHILPLHDSGEADGFLFYVMPYIEGETLEDRLEREKQLPVDEAVTIAVDVAQALHAAHEQGVIHRDVKPANILLSSGRPLVADFGIALAVTAAGGGRLTETGLSMGTPYYMSPEQATADRDLDARSDVYSLACVAYEMLTGDPPHTGSTAQAVMASVLTEDPRRITSRRSTVPPHVEASVHRALEKLPADRFSSAAEFARAMEEPGQTMSFHTPARPDPERDWGRLLPWGVAAALATLLFWSLQSEPAAEVRPLVATLLMEEGLSATGDLALSPDETRLAYVAGTVGGEAGIWIRELDGETRLLPDTEGADDPFWSPDGTRIAFFAGDGLHVVPATGGSAYRVADAPRPGGGDWNANDEILFSPATTELFLVPAAGGTPVQITQPVPSSVGQMDPVFLPGGGFLFWVWDGPRRNIYIGDLETGETRLLMQGSKPQWIDEGYLVFAQSGVFAQRFDPSTGQFEGQPSALFNDPRSGAEGAVMTARSGTIVYQQSVRDARGPAYWQTRDGAVSDSSDLGGGFKRSMNVQGTHVASSGGNLYVHDVARNVSQRVETEPYPIHHAWSPDGTRIIYNSNDTRSLRIVDLTGTRDEEVVFESDRADMSMLEWAPDGQTVLFVRQAIEDRRFDELWALDLESKTAAPVPVSPRNVLSAKLSPDGNWLAYVSDEVRTFDVYLRPYPGPGRAVKVSQDGGAWPLWRADGRELFYLTGDGRIAVVQVTLDSTPQISAPEVLPGDPLTSSPFRRIVSTPFVVSPDGQRLLIRPARQAEGSAPFTILRDWQGLLDDRD